MFCVLDTQGVNRITSAVLAWIPIPRMSTGNSKDDKYDGDTGDTGDTLLSQNISHTRLSSTIWRLLSGDQWAPGNG